MSGGPRIVRTHCDLGTISERAGADPAAAPGLAGAAPVYEKLEFSGFANPGLRAALTAEAGRNTILCGIEAHVCVLQTALEMREAGERVTVVADAISSRQAGSRVLAIERMRAAGIDVVSSEMVLFEWLRVCRAGIQGDLEIDSLIARFTNLQDQAFKT